MSNWNKFVKEVGVTLKIKPNDILLKTKIENLKETVRSIKNSPEHLGQLEMVIKSKKKSSKILDHGCGNCLTVLFLILKGYKNVWGATVNFKNDIKTSNYVNNVNRIISSILNVKNSKRVIIYNGFNLPFQKNYFDIIFTKQVLEHISPEDRLDFWYEEKRVLDNDGVLYHQIPHRLVPFEAHTKKWFFHWFPKNINLKILGKGSAEYDFTKNYLFLQWPWEIVNDLNNLNLYYKNITYQRLSRRIKGREFGLLGNLIRIILFSAFRIPLIGKKISKLLSCFFMLELIVTKKNEFF